MVRFIIKFNYNVKGKLELYYKDRLNEFDPMDHTDSKDMKVLYPFTKGFNYERKLRLIEASGYRSGTIYKGKDFIKITNKE